MQFNWEDFDNWQAAKDNEGIHVTVNKRGHFYFNGRAIKALGDPDTVMLMYDRQLKVIGIKAALSDHKRGFRVFAKQGDKLKGRCVYATRFCLHFSIRPDRTYAFPSAKLTDDGVLVLDLNDIRPAKRR
jgi:hypothetical protein